MDFRQEFLPRRRRAQRKLRQLQKPYGSRRVAVLPYAISRRSHINLKAAGQCGTQEVRKATAESRVVLNGADDRRGRPRDAFDCCLLRIWKRLLMVPALQKEPSDQN